jgi:hypothetical protein
MKKPGRRFAVTAGLCVLLAAAVAFAVITASGLSAAHRDNARLRAQVSVLTQIQTGQSAQLAGLRRDVADLQGKVSGLTVPTDPLSAYDQICDMPNVTNQTTGVTQTYWFPCTNNAQTIPQPGN